MLRGFLAGRIEKDMILKQDTSQSFKTGSVLQMEEDFVVNRAARLVELYIR